MDQKSLQQLLQKLPIPSIHFLEVTTSTNSDALVWAANGALDSSLVVANQQTAGRGRFGRHWETHPNSALAFTLIFRPSMEEHRNIPLFSPLGAVAVCQTIQQFCKIPSQVKWPNDVLIYGKKVCGVLAESDWRDGVVRALVLGIGINISPASLPSASSLHYPATSIEIECGHPVDREQLLLNILTKLFALRSIISSEEFLHLWESNLAFRGEAITLASTSEKTVSGLLKGINKDGELLVLLESGEERCFRLGEIKLRPQI